MSTRQLLERVTGAPVNMFRPPYGARDPALDAEVQRLGLLELTWNVDTQDAEGASAAGIEQLAGEGMRPGAIILMHETYARSLAALPQVLTASR